jgi:hypothetical protein
VAARQRLARDALHPGDRIDLHETRRVGDHQGAVSALRDALGRLQNGLLAEQGLISIQRDGQPAFLTGRRSDRCYRSSAEAEAAPGGTLAR